MANTVSLRANLSVQFNLDTNHRLPIERKAEA